MRKAFHKGSNSSNRFHIRQHYEVYKERCEKGKIPVHHWATPPNIVKAKAAEEVKEEGQLNLGFKVMIGPHKFTRAGTLHAVAELIATNNQVSLSFSVNDWKKVTLTIYKPLALADHAAFRNTLVSMRPKSTKADLPTPYDAKVHIHNEFTKHMEQIKLDIMVSQFIYNE